MIIEENFYCPGCGQTAHDEKECCGTTMLERSEAEGFGLSDFEPVGGGIYEYSDDWN
jgi:hypothetical protein